MMTQELMMFTLEELRVKNKVIAFNTAESALNFLYQTKEEPFLIISDINMPKMDVIAFKKRIDSCAILNSRSIPFVFVSTCTNVFPQARGLNPRILPKKQFNGTVGKNYGCYSNLLESYPT